MSGHTAGKVTWTLDEVAATTGLTYRQVYERVRDKKLRTVKIGKNHLVRMDALADLLGMTVDELGQYLAAQQSPAAA